MSLENSLRSENFLQAVLDELRQVSQNGKIQAIDILFWSENEISPKKDQAVYWLPNARLYCCVSYPKNEVKETKQGKMDLENYANMQVPIPSEDEADKALRNFFDAVEKARKEFHIAEVHVITQVNIQNVGRAIASFHIGNELEAATMCAWALGQEQKSFETKIRSLVGGAS